jgi:chloramphenicol O-acetyltransferase type A
MKQKLDIDNWVRKEHFHFFNQFEEPFYGLCITLDCTKAYKVAKEKSISFFLYSLYQSLTAANTIEPFKYRIENGEVLIYDRIDGGSTIARSNGTFGYGSLTYHPSLDLFIAEGNKVVEQVQQATTLVRSSAENIIRYSSLPWIDFTSLSHARMYSVKDSCPRISFGKMTEKDGKRTMPVSIHVHHALVDGLNVGQYIDCFQALMNSEL